MLKLHKLFLNDGHSKSFDVVIEPIATQRDALIVAKNKIRDRLHDRIRAASINQLGMDKMVSPRFRTQGSWRYRTCVQPAHLPPQEMDWDFGVYLPVTLWSENGPPAPMAKLYFNLVEAALRELCREEGWSLDTGKATCVRVHISAWAHIDVPLYAASEAEFAEVVEKSIGLASFSAATQDRKRLDESIDAGELPEVSWDDMEGVYLAKRDGTWQKSDPEAVSRWFEDVILSFGAGGVQLRRMCRYLKAWRDFHWPNGDGPSSVLLMILVAEHFAPKSRRDDLAVEHVAQGLAIGLGSDVRERGIDNGVEQFNRLKSDARRVAVARANDLANKMKLARSLGPGLRADAIGYVRGQFGNRIAPEVDWVEMDDGADVVRSTPAATVALPLVGATHAG